MRPQWGLRGGPFAAGKCARQGGAFLPRPRSPSSCAALPFTPKQCAPSHCGDEGRASEGPKARVHDQSDAKNDQVVSAFRSAIGELFTVCAHFEQPGGRQCAFNILSHAERGRTTWDHCRHCRRQLCRPWHRGERHQSSDTVDAVLEGDVDVVDKARSIRRGRQIAEPDEPCKGGTEGLITTAGLTGHGATHGRQG